MNVADEFSWVNVYEYTDENEAYRLEKIFYYNKMRCQIRNESCSIWVPKKYEQLSRTVIDNALADNLDSGILYEYAPETPQDKVVIDHSYEVKIPKKFFWLVMLMTLAPALWIFAFSWFK